MQALVDRPVRDRSSLRTLTQSAAADSGVLSSDPSGTIIFPGVSRANGYIEADTRIPDAPPIAEFLDVFPSH